MKEVSIKSTPSKIPTYQRTATTTVTATHGVKSNTNSNMPMRKSNTTPLKPSSATTVAATAQPGTPSNSRQAAIQAKLQSTAERIKKVASLKDKWAKEKQKKMQSYRDKRAAGMFTLFGCNKNSMLV